VEYYAALLSTGYGYYGTAVYVHEAGRRGIQALPPHINRSGLLYLPEGTAIRAPLPLVRDLGGRGAAAILQARQTGPFRSLSDFCRRLGRGALRRSALVNLIKVGAFDGLGLNRRQALACLDYILKRTDRFPGQMTLWPPLAGCSLPELAEYNEEEILAAEAEVLGMTLSRHPLARFAGRLSGISRLPLAELPRKEAGEEATVAAIVLARSRRRLPRGGIMLTLFLSDESGFAEAVVYPREHRRLLRQLQENMLLLKGKKTTESDSLAVEDAVPLVLLPEKEKEKRAAN
jgi:DNA polymerase-3 subunit alpha